MDVLQASAPYLVGTIVATLAWAFFKQTRRHDLPYPPGPKRLPLIGNLLDFPTEQEWLVYRNWNEQYGNVVYTEVLGQKIVILGSANVVTDLLERKSAMYSDRPHLVMTHELMDCGWVISIAPYGEHWRKGRKLLHTHVNVKTTPMYYPVLITSARQLLVALLAAPQQPSTIPRAVRFNVGQTMIKVVYGIDVYDSDSEFISMPEQLFRCAQESMIPGRFLVDVIPALRHVPAWMPGAGFQAFGRNAAILSRKVRDLPVALVNASMVDGTAVPSMVRSMIERKSPREALASPGSALGLASEDEEDELIKEVGAMAYLAGSDTTAAAIESFFLAMLIYPDVQLKAQAEIDRVVGRDRLPNMDDMASLPYVNAMVTESLRWLPVAPLGIPHMNMGDDEYQGYLIPKGSIIFPSIWAILHDAQDYPDPEVFNPERYVTRTTSGAYEPKADAPNPRAAAFGYGRRSCPGRYLADASIFASIATTLATVNIVRAKDAQGNAIIPEAAQNSGALSHPKPFKYALECKNAKSQRLLTGSQESL